MKNTIKQESAPKFTSCPFVLCFILLSIYLSVNPLLAEEKQALGSGVSPQNESSIRMLSAISELKENLSKRLAQKKALIEKSNSSAEKEQLETEFKKLDEQYNQTKADFERIATGVDIGLFRHEQKQDFDWQKELLSLIEPGVNELKRITEEIRNKSKLKDELAYYNMLSSLAQRAVENIKLNITNAGDRNDKAVTKSLEALLPEWQNIFRQFENRAQITQMKLKEIISKEKSLIESSQDSVKKFFRTRGLYLFIGIIAFIGTILIMRLGTNYLVRLIPGYRLPYKPFHIRLIDLSARVASLFAGLSILGLVFYLFEDWVLLSLFIIFLLGLGWTVRSTLPRFLKQSRLMLNIGAVREGERLIYHGVPWLVKNIHLFCTLENPTMGLTLRLPIEKLLDQVSRPFHPDEPWFPCQKDDWLILADGTYGQVKIFSHETVELLIKTGTLKLYQTLDFLSQAPLNISKNFRLRIAFGISYDLQKDATKKIPDTIKQYIREAIRKEGYEEGFMRLTVEFEAANSSSLDLLVIADFDGKLASEYNKLSRAVQRWCVDACTLNNWEIPFPQLTVHKK
jgi:hypothetical protein